jgi:hypothetical protein
MTNHSKVKAGKAPKKNHKVVRIAHAEVNADAQSKQKVAGTAAHSVSARITTGARNVVSQVAKMAPHKAGSELKRR